MSTQERMGEIGRLLRDASDEISAANHARELAETNYEMQKRNTVAFAKDVEALRVESARRWPAEARMLELARTMLGAIDDGDDTQTEVFGRKLAAEILKAFGEKK